MENFNVLFSDLKSRSKKDKLRKKWYLRLLVRPLFHSGQSNCSICTSHHKHNISRQSIHITVLFWITIT